MNGETLDQIEAWQRDGHGVAVAQVVRTYRSAPRPVGAIFAVSSDGRMAGSVSGGCVEGAIYAEAQALFSGEAQGPLVLHYGISDELAGDVGLACGGELWVSLDLMKPRPQLRRGAIVTVISGEDAGARLVLDADRNAVDTDLPAGIVDEALQAAYDALAREQSAAVSIGERSLFVEPIHPPHRVVVVGAVDTAEHVCRLATQLGWRSVVIDPRRKFATAERIPSADRIEASWPAEGFDAIGLEPADSVVVLTHDPKVDDPALEEALRRSAAYVGALGSRRTQALRKQRLIDTGLDAAVVERIHGPVGLDIGAHTPAEMAVSIVAELIADRSGRSGTRLVATSGRIHPASDEPVDPAVPLPQTTRR
jgi:xanthine dehydrogenase accessory factor